MPHEAKGLKAQPLLYLIGFNMTNKLIREVEYRGHTIKMYRTDSFSVRVESDIEDLDGLELHDNSYGDVYVAEFASERFIDGLEAQSNTSNVERFKNARTALELLKADYDDHSDEYADISQTIWYLDQAIRDMKD